MKASNLLSLLLIGACFTSALPAEEPVPLAERTFRVIRETQSPDKRFAVGFGLTTDRAKAGQPRLIEDDPASEAARLDNENPNLRNYVVDLRDQSILAETCERYYRANPAYNRDQCTAHWSPDSRTVVQVTTQQGRYGNATLLRVDAGGRRVTPPFDLKAAAEEQAMAFLKKRRNPALLALTENEEFAVRPLFLNFTNDTVALTVWGAQSQAPQQMGRAG
jgi:hypothetical protein